MQMPSQCPSLFGKISSYAFCFFPIWHLILIIAVVISHFIFEIFFMILIVNYLSWKWVLYWRKCLFWVELSGDDFWLPVEDTTGYGVKKSFDYAFFIIYLGFWEFNICLIYKLGKKIRKAIIFYLRWRVHLNFDYILYKFIIIMHE